jgi:hypothetical protein
VHPALTAHMVEDIMLNADPIRLDGVIPRGASLTLSPPRT